MPRPSTSTGNECHLNLRLFCFRARLEAFGHAMPIQRKQILLSRFALVSSEPPMREYQLIFQLLDGVTYPSKQVEGNSKNYFIFVFYPVIFKIIVNVGLKTQKIIDER